MLKFNRTYFLLTILLLAIEISIAFYIPDGFIRHYLGDVIVVILIYCFLRTILKLKTVPLIYGVLLFVFTIEILQYFKLVEKSGFSNCQLASVIMGSTFDWMDLGMYILGVVLVLFVENGCRKTKINFKT
ncbi:MAG: DUF2809 domain-containing protein [Bacteroidetes bacterium HGW-Bacteroidetes-2]|jgi:hypothetical protein|nr:MAG: DUF2809 domain-containing protein [Bacteroidetes bacterium HGW-Bacteroidetes-2]